MFKVKIISRRGILFCYFGLSMMVIMIYGLHRRLLVLYGGSLALIVLYFYFMVLLKKVDCMRHITLNLLKNILAKINHDNLKWVYHQAIPLVFLWNRFHFNAT